MTEYRRKRRRRMRAGVQAVRTRLVRLRAANHRLREDAERWRRSVVLASVAAALLGVVAVGAGVAALQEEPPEAIALGVGQAGLKPLPAAPPAPIPTATPRGEAAGEGGASFYGEEFRGRRTASGETFNPSGLTAAHRTLPFGTKLRVTNVDNGRTVTVRVNDRGPFAKRRVLDLSHAAAARLGMVDSGTATVKLEVVPEG